MKVQTLLATGLALLTLGIACGTTEDAERRIGELERKVTALQTAVAPLAESVRPSPILTSRTLRTAIPAPSPTRASMAKSVPTPTRPRLFPPTPVPTSTPCPTPPPIIGQAFEPRVVRSGQLELTVAGTQDPYQPPSLCGSAPEGERYLAVFLRLRNIGDRFTLSSLAGSFDLRDDTQTVHSSRGLSRADLRSFPSVKLGPGDQVEGSYGYILAESRRPVALIWDPLVGQTVVVPLE